MTIESSEIRGPAGRLEAVLNVPDAPDPPRRVAVVCHPHPLYGGTLHNKVVFHAARALAELGWPVLRFNYRGVGASQGRLPREAGEEALIVAGREDLNAAIGWLLDRYDDTPLCTAGFSFGSQVVLEQAAVDRRIERIIAIGVPVGAEHFSHLRELAARLPQPKLFIQGDRDEYGPPDSIRQVFYAAPEPKRLMMVPGAGHFFDGHLDALRAAVVQAGKI